jgi:hypothetical protein
VRDAGEQIRDKGLFREDGERIVVYANRGALLRQTFMQIVVVALFVGGYLWLSATLLTGLWQIVIGLGLALILGLVLLIMSLALVRLTMRGPTLIVNADGIVDNGSLIATGRGLLRWNEVLGVENIVVDVGSYPLRFRSIAKAWNGAFDINLVDFSAVRQRQPLWKRVLGVVTGGKQVLGPRLYRGLLDRPAAELVAQINDYIKRHAPPGSWHSRLAEYGDEDESDGADDMDAGDSSQTLPCWASGVAALAALHKRAYSER